MRTAIGTTAGALVAVVVGRCDTVEDVGGVAVDLDVVVGELAELDVVDTGFFVVGGDAEGEAGDEVEEEEDDAGQDEGVGEAGDGVGDLVA